MSRSVHIALASAFLLAAATPALAQNYQSQVVTYGELDLNSRAGADTLIRRIEQASDNVCGDRTGPRSVRENSTVNACARETAEFGVEDVGHPNVTQRYYERHGTGYIEGSYDPYYDSAYAPSDKK
ncbi:MAG: UrcA family protein [Caulobacterales bacterium]|nr:UrcA family protein [Caulobacterales bacterium]